MLTTKNKKDCCMVSSLEFCHQNSCNAEPSDAVEVIKKTNTVLLTDQILVLRTVNGNEREIYKANFNSLDSEVAIMIMEKAVQVMSRTDPANGKSLWLDEGFIRVATSDPSYLGTLAPNAMQKSLKEAFKVLPTTDPGDGSPWLNDGVLTQGSH